MSERRADDTGPGAPATVTISNLACNTGGGMADLSAVVTIVASQTAAVTDVKVKVNGTESGSAMPQGAPTPSGGSNIHKWDWTHGGVPCDASYELEAVVTVTETSDVASGKSTVTCPACGGM